MTAESPPIGEQNWAQGWEPLFFVEDTSPMRGRAFSTEGGDHSATWLITDYDPDDLSIAYARFTAGRDIALIAVDFQPIDDGSTRVSVRYDYTSVSQAGDHYVRAMDEGYEAYVAHWKEAIDAFLESHR